MPTILGKEIGPIGYGLMGLTWSPKPPSEEQSFAAMKAALEAGCNFWNGGEIYGPPDANSLHLLAKYFTKYPEDADKVVLSIKGGYGAQGPDSSPENVRRSVDNCLRLLDGKKKLDIFECARFDKKTPIEVTMKVLEEEYVNTGKIGGISLSEVSANTVRKAAKATKIVACEVELSLWALDIFKNGVAEACAEANIPVVAYSPIGRGFLSGKLKSPDDMLDGEYRKGLPRFQPGAFEHNLELVRDVEQIAKKKGCTPAQLAIGWVLHLSKKGKNPEIFPIPGASSVEHARENSVMVTLTDEELASIDSILSEFEPVGARYGGIGATYMEV
ncbi:NADP-dependent oxidoreductase domain-containing protein [Xylogone sp. PMI_703]|nr:NADP-dependent oxidoreductase domain-containing protein [Xylogone sp. PMI_703]